MGCNNLKVNKFGKSEVKANFKDPLHKGLGLFRRRGQANLCAEFNSDGSADFNG